MPDWNELMVARSEADNARRAFDRVIQDAMPSLSADATAITGMAVGALCLELRALGMVIHRALQEASRG